MAINALQNNKTNIEKVNANSFSVEFSKIISLSERTAFIIYEDRYSNFDEKTTL